MWIAVNNHERSPYFFVSLLNSHTIPEKKMWITCGVLVDK